MLKATRQCLSALDGPLSIEGSRRQAGIAAECLLPPTDSYSTSSSSTYELTKMELLWYLPICVQCNILLYEKSHFYLSRIVLLLFYVIPREEVGSLNLDTKQVCARYFEVQVQGTTKCVSAKKSSTCVPPGIPGILLILLTRAYGCCCIMLEFLLAG